MNRNVAISAGLIVAVLVAVVLLTGGGNDYTVKAEFKDVGGLRKNNSVKIAGVPAGKVTDLQITKRDTAIATFKIRKNAAPIGEGASIAVRPTDLLGEHYAEVSPGDRAHPLPSGSMIPMSKTSVPVELDDIFNILQPDTRARLGIMLNELGVALHGRGYDLNKLLAELPPDLGQTRALLSQVAAQNTALKAMIAKGDGITATINAKRDDMGTLIDRASSALETVAARRVQLGRTIENAPAALTSLRSALGNLDSAATGLRPFASQLTASARPLDATLRALPSFAGSAAPTLHTATQVAPSLTKLGRDATPTVRRLQPTAKVIAATLRPAAPILSELKFRGMDDVLYFLNNWNLGMAGRDSIGHTIAARPVVDSSYITDAIGALDPSPALKAATEKNPSKRGTAPALGLPKLPAAKKLRLPDRITKLPKRLLDKVAPLAAKTVSDAVKAVPEVLSNVTGALTGKSGSGPGGTLLGGGGAAGKSRDKSTGGSDALRLYDYLMGP